MLSSENFTIMKLFISFLILITLRDDCKADDDFEEISEFSFSSLEAIPKCGEGNQKDKFKCVPYYHCDVDTNNIVDYPEVDGSNNLAPRDYNIEPRCENYLEVCCQISNFTENAVVHGPTVSIEFEPRCGIKGDGSNEVGSSSPGEFPWMVALLLSNGENVPFCGGSLISPTVVLTAAHCVAKLKPDEIKIRAGEWHFGLSGDQPPFQERNVSEVITHGHYFETPLYNDVALLILDKSLVASKNIRTVCIPRENDLKTIDLDNCFVSGWGQRFVNDGSFSKILKKLEVSVMSNRSCQELLASVIDDEFLLHRSFVCANGTKNNYTCSGDGGSPLVCPDSSLRYHQMGIVSWGIGVECGTSSIPDVYTNAALFRDWIDKTLVEIGYNPKPYTV